MHPDTPYENRKQSVNSATRTHYQFVKAHAANTTFNQLMSNTVRLAIPALLLKARIRVNHRGLGGAMADANNAQYLMRG
jgi:hypothetical protein